MDLREFFIKRWWIVGVAFAVLWWTLSVSPPFSRILVNLLFYLYLGISLLLFWMIKARLAKKEAKPFAPTKWDVIIGMLWSLSFIFLEGNRAFSYFNFPFKIWGKLFKEIFHITRGEDFLFLGLPLLVLGTLTSIFVVYIVRIIIEKIMGEQN